MLDYNQWLCCYQLNIFCPLTIFYSMWQFGFIWNVWQQRYLQLEKGFLSLFISVYLWMNTYTDVKMYKLYVYKEKFLMTIKIFPTSFVHDGHFQGISYECRNYISLVSIWDHIKKCRYISSVLLNIGLHPESQLNLRRVNRKRETFLT